MTLARLELHNLKTAIEKRKKHAAEKVGSHLRVPTRFFSSCVLAREARPRPLLPRAFVAVLACH